MQKPSSSNGKQIATGILASVGEFTTFADLIDNANKRSDAVKKRQEWNCRIDSNITLYGIMDKK